ncbi:MAG: IPExxxVDY family protein [Flavobacterium sp.]|nr:IPExxxVDY family protein [Flavobacterium sp.]
MAIHKLHLDEFDEVDYELIAIHTSLEDYRLAYYINQKLPVLLYKSKDEIQITIKEGETRFSRFTYEDTEKEIAWNLIQNKNEVTLQNKQSNLSLFADTAIEISTKVYLLPEFKKVDYFLKIENAQSSVTSITKKINTIDRIATVYKVDIQQIKSKNNLIF